MFAVLLTALKPRWASTNSAFSSDEYSMNSTDFDGTLVLEKLAEIDKIDEFFDAVDSDNFEEAIALMRLARIDKETISLVIEQMKSTHGVTLK